MSQSGVNWGLLQAGGRTAGNSGPGVTMQNAPADQVSSPLPKPQDPQQPAAAPTPGGAPAPASPKPGGLGGFLQNLFGTNSVSQANAAVSGQIAQAGPQATAQSILGGTSPAQVNQAMPKPQLPPGVQQQMPQQPQADPQTDLSSSLIKHFEGFQTQPYWDTNAYRVGYGSDTITKGDGSIKRVMPGMQITQEDADRDLNRRVQQSQSTAADTVGKQAWGGLPPTAQGALTSLTYNYGHLPKTVASAVQTGDLNAVAKSVKNLSYQNNGVNAKRRIAEANMITMQQQPFAPPAGAADNTAVSGPSAESM